MIELTENTMQRAIAKARAEAKNLVVRMTTAARMYRVENKAKGAIYTVNFFVRNGKRFGNCDCKAGQDGRFACKHLAAAAGLNQYLASQGALNKKAVSVR
jgi:uncharacterized Zn finger protein